MVKTAADALFSFKRVLLTSHLISHHLISLVCIKHDSFYMHALTVFPFMPFKDKCLQIL